jgi:hypothetical protein
MANETTVGMTVELDNVDIADYVSEATVDTAIVTVDCTAIGDDTTDNRAGTLNPTGSLTVILKDDSAPSVSVGDVVELDVDGEAADVIVTGVSFGGGVNQPRTLRITFASTLES